MTCAACGHANPAESSFCLECGRPLTMQKSARRGTWLSSLRVRSVEFRTSVTLVAPEPCGARAVDATGTSRLTAITETCQRLNKVLPTRGSRAL